MTRVRVVLITAPSEEIAAGIARSLVEEKLAACANLIPSIRSIYRWEGKIHDDPEVLLILKTTAERYPALESRALELHPYETPEILCLSVEAGAQAYLDWVAG